jgi:hypothetical protein
MSSSNLVVRHAKLVDGALGRVGHVACCRPIIYTVTPSHRRECDPSHCNIGPSEPCLVHVHQAIVQYEMANCEPSKHEMSAHRFKPTFDERLEQCRTSGQRTCSIDLCLALLCVCVCVCYCLLLRQVMDELQSSNHPQRQPIRSHCKTQSDTSYKIASLTKEDSSPYVGGLLTVDNDDDDEFEVCFVSSVFVASL